MVTRGIRYFIGGILLATALGKALDVAGFVDVIGTYQIVPVWLARPIAVGMVFTEFVLAMWLWWGHHLVWAALSSVVLHLGLTTLAVRTLLAQIPVPNCGCFGVFFSRPLAWSTVQEDAFMVALSAVLAWLASRQKASGIMTTSP